MRARLYTPGRLAMALLANRAVVVATLALLAGRAHGAGGPFRQSFEFASPAEAIATIEASCARCDWGVAGREAASLRLEVDGRYVQHLTLFRGEAPSEYRVLLGPLPPGRHELLLTHDEAGSSKNAGDPSVHRVAIREAGEDQPDHRAIAHAPFVHARPNTVGRFSDVPLLAWYETDRTPRGTRYRYSIVFSNEDGGTPPDRLLATWGRLTDIEYVYGVEIDAAGEIVSETYQGKDHKIVPFRGKREGRHPVLYVVTDNNMVRDDGEATPRYAVAPVPMDLAGASRELVMDENPWSYAVAAREARREGRVVESPARGSRKIRDPRLYAVVEACTDSPDSSFATFAFEIGVRATGGSIAYFDSRGGVEEFRISRSPSEFPNGCFRGAAALPAGSRAEDVATLRFHAEKRKPREGEPGNTARGPAHLRRINRVLIMNERDEPGSSFFSWSGKEALALGGPGVAIEVKPAIRSQEVQSQ